MAVFYHITSKEECQKYCTKNCFNLPHNPIFAHFADFEYDVSRWFYNTCDMDMDICKTGRGNLNVIARTCFQNSKY